MASVLLQPVLKQYPTTLPFLSAPDPFPRSISPNPHYFTSFPTTTNLHHSSTHPSNALPPPIPSQA
ncbi:hypothetical protein SESBI_46434 [Sesbania bispinosa]|nr:hypothetical protein SESBI_46434 [Sesbania bispinosa]